MTNFHFCYQYVAVEIENIQTPFVKGEEAQTHVSRSSRYLMPKRNKNCLDLCPRYPSLFFFRFSQMYCGLRALAAHCILNINECNC